MACASTDSSVPDIHALSNTVTTVLSHLESITKQLKRQEDANARQEKILAKISDRVQTQDEAIKKLASAVKLIDAERHDQAIELKKLGSMLGFVTLTEDGKSPIRTRATTEPGTNEDEDNATELRTTVGRQPHQPTAPLKGQPVNSELSINTLKPSEALRTVETLNGRNDIGVEEFIKSVRFARSRTNDQETLLRMILTERITDFAKQSFRFCQIHGYEELYEALRTQVSLPSTVSGSRNKMQTIRQGISESVQSYTNRFRQALSELEYAIQAKHRNPVARSIALEEENIEAVRLYTHNLKREISQYVIPMRLKSLIEAQQEAINMEVWCKESRPIPQ